MFEICETNPFDSLSKSIDENEGKNILNEFFFETFSFLVLTFDSDDDFELV